MSFIASLSNSAFDHQYVQAVRHLNVFTAAVESISSPTRGSQYSKAPLFESALTQIKKEVNIWPNTLAPEIRAVPQSIVQWNPQLQEDVTQLKAYAQQPQPFSPIVKEGIKASALSAFNILKQSHRAVSSLSVGLSQLRSQLTTSLYSINHFYQMLRTQDSHTQNEYATLTAQYQHELHASKPSKSKLDAIGKKIDALLANGKGIQAWEEAFDTIRIAGINNQPAPAAYFLAEYWNKFVEDLSHIMNKLDTISQVPEVLKTVSITQADSSWNRIFHDMQQISQTL